MAQTDLVSAYASDDEREAEATLRPRRLAEFIAQHRVREQLDLLLQGAMRRGAAAGPHPALRLAGAGQDHAWP